MVKIDGSGTTETTVFKMKTNHILQAATAPKNGKLKL